MCGYINNVNDIDVNLRLYGWVDIVNNHENVPLRIFLVAALKDRSEDESSKNRSFNLMTG